jgi:hypothetical protein
MSPKSRERTIEEVVKVKFEANVVLAIIFGCMVVSCNARHNNSQAQKWPETVNVSGASCDVSLTYSAPVRFRGVCRTMVEIVDSCLQKRNSVNFVALPDDAQLNSCRKMRPEVDFFPEASFHEDYEKIAMLHSAKKHLQSLTWAEANSSGIGRKNFDALKTREMSLLIGLDFHRFDAQTRQDQFQAIFALPDTRNDVGLILGEDGSKIEWGLRIVD